MEMAFFASLSFSAFNEVLSIRSSFLSPFAASNSAELNLIP